jgi:hypothetical protein
MTDKKYQNGKYTQSDIKMIIERVHHFAPASLALFLSLALSLYIYIHREREREREKREDRETTI